MQRTIKRIVSRAKSFKTFFFFWYALFRKVTLMLCINNRREMKNLKKKIN